MAMAALGSCPAPQQLRWSKKNHRRPSKARVTAVAMAAAASSTKSKSDPRLLLRDEDTSDSMRARFEAMILSAQEEVCDAVEAVDGSKFRQDVWTRPGGGGGVSRVLQDGNVWEKAGVNVSVVYGTMPPEAYRAAKADTSVTKDKAGRIPFFAAGISSVMHPKNPFAPTVHFNYRYFETDTPKDVEGAPRSWWFGGGTDFTPSYIFDEDVKHFHEIQKRACDKFDPEYYPKFKKWCDDYFLIEHRGERRGLGGIFFDDLNDRDPEQLLGFATECANSVVDAYIPIVEKRKDTPFTQANKDWQQLRRGRYVEFNLVSRENRISNTILSLQSNQYSLLISFSVKVYDRGTTFGLKTGGRIESILMSLPLSARWEYDHQPIQGSEEWNLLDACKNPREWL
ncbi:coproporphyrinogen-III oxidase 1, chloroplastic isoform X1 [Selaginella moellendorffii]|uniref:coproporphyrinogen-III oxidase 1, chloroplastic isoform X1 n=1 Tax=Selaginella moellendorffii TaxID=88036 RepID=UPI000D1C5EDE|nr:coproporphyrinogen-III oxidase 1, chloroplastic isoform X1 [Selaginella moellendorffii]|eukprot:XP_024519752.1 coproporphyrinogen-III oxidase 1, chloroplastic isoform X1 [Selaginella moellendorffii]